MPWVPSTQLRTSLQLGSDTELFLLPQRRRRKRKRRPNLHLRRHRQLGNGSKVILAARFVGGRRVQTKRRAYRLRGRTKQVQALFWKALGRGWDPYKGTRVGEASNPGPAGLRHTRRKRLEKTQADAWGGQFQGLVQAVS